MTCRSANVHLERGWEEWSSTKHEQIDYLFALEGWGYIQNISTYHLSAKIITRMGSTPRSLPLRLRWVLNSAGFCVHLVMTLGNSWKFRSTAFRIAPGICSLFRSRPAGRQSQGRFHASRPAGHCRVHRPAGQTGWLAGWLIVLVCPCVRSVPCSPAGRPNWLAGWLVDCFGL